MASITFPTPVRFDTCGGVGTSMAATKVLEEAAEFVEAVKRCERTPTLKDAYYSINRAAMVSEAMDVYQAVSNFLGSPEMGYMATFDGYTVRTHMDKKTAMGVLCAAARLFAELGKYDPQHSADNAKDVLYNLAHTLCGSVTDDEIVAAYSECVRRNRERGRL